MPLGARLSAAPTSAAKADRSKIYFGQLLSQSICIMREPLAHPRISDGRTFTSWPARRKETAAVRPATPAPIMITLRGMASGKRPCFP